MTRYPTMEISGGFSRLRRDARQSWAGHSRGRSFLEASVDERHQVDELHLRVWRSTARPGHDRTEGYAVTTVSARSSAAAQIARLKCACPFSSSLVREEQTAARPQYTDPRLRSPPWISPPEPCRQRSRLVDCLCVATGITRVVIGHLLVRGAGIRAVVARELFDERRRMHDVHGVAELAVILTDRLHAVRAGRHDGLG